jgi:hypothetical protein
MRPESSSAAEPAMPSWNDEGRHQRARTECLTLCETLRDRLAGGVLSPDEAYWWARIVAEEIAAIADARRD